MNQPPGMERSSAEQGALEAAFDAMPDGYQPRTHLWMNDRPAYINRLIHEGSPYLLQHAHNPVDWWPWGEAAMQEAQAKDKPIFLSAGYATCHWCHVMEEESFDNPQVAAALNRDFIPVKLDREQRPDIDQVYILATTLQHRHAGWPNSVWLFPDGRPFHTGTYFQRPRFLQLLEAISQAWQGDGRAELDKFATNLADGIQRLSARAEPPKELSLAPEAANLHLSDMFNEQNGGFGNATQFPHEGYLLFLMDHWRRSGDDHALDMALKSLDEMQAGGLHDQVGGGFHRYTVDVNWRTPHFEKMLYNQALMLQCLTEAWHITGEKTYARSAERLVAYLLRDMVDTDGAFFTAEDADSLDEAGKLEEGAFYCWTPEGVRSVLGNEADFAISTLGIDAPPTLEAGAVPHLQPGMPTDFDRLDPLLERLRAARETRPRPLRDDKIIAGWNGLMIRALADAANVFGRDDWLDTAGRAMEAVLHRLFDGRTLARLHARGLAREDGNLSDYAWLTQGALALVLAGRDSFLSTAQQLAEIATERFSVGGGRLALTASGPLGPVFESEDGATPSAESSMLDALAMLDTIVPSPERRARGQALRSSLSGSIAAMPIVRLAGLQASRNLDDGYTSPVRHVADGKARVALVRQEACLRFRIECQPGWHLGGPHLAGDPPIVITGSTSDIPELSEPVQALTVPLPAPQQQISLSLRICSDSVCTAPEIIHFRIET
ncbi:thioredoxin domain-containing protein [Algicella marina]|uniref:DUF255 domain-containing protein n=1 Tax=Algicella marina TaxID=2683284 RepID=A0A6P1T3A1_9RHOB|nr:thioredoxin domain-containing protein [Algicella marina]QHQ34992.1 DUF255 domain-containing protein [Algicella marina]